MTCKGIRVDGNHCTMPDESTDPKTGLCGFCGAPQSTALVLMGETGLTADPEVDAKYRGLPPKAQAFIRGFVETRRIGEASKVAGVNRNLYRYWLKNVPNFSEVFEVARLDVVDQWRDVYADLAENGLKEWTYDEDGKLKQTRIRQDAATAKAQLMSIDPDFAPDRDKGTGIITIILNHTNEGGWTEEDVQKMQQAKPKDLESIPEAEVIETETVNVPIEEEQPS